MLISTKQLHVAREALISDTEDPKPLTGKSPEIQRRGQQDLMEK